MDRDLNRKSLLIGAPGILLQIAGNIIARSAPPDALGPALGGLALALAGTILLIWGLSLYARAKGQSGWFG